MWVCEILLIFNKKQDCQPFFYFLISMPNWLSIGLTTTTTKNLSLGSFFRKHMFFPQKNLRGFELQPAFWCFGNFVLTQQQLLGWSKVRKTILSRFWMLIFHSRKAQVAHYFSGILTKSHLKFFPP